MYFLCRWTEVFSEICQSSYKVVMLAAQPVSRGALDHGTLAKKLFHGLRLEQVWFKLWFLDAYLIRTTHCCQCLLAYKLIRRRRCGHLPHHIVVHRAALVALERHSDIHVVLVSCNDLHPRCEYLVECRTRLIRFRNAKIGCFPDCGTFWICSTVSTCDEELDYKLSERRTEVNITVCS